MSANRLDQILDREVHPDGVHRDHNGRPLIIVPGVQGTRKCNLCQQQVQGRPYQRVTTFIDVLEDKEGVQKWKQRNIVKGLSLRSDLALRAASEINNNKALDEVIEAAIDTAGGTHASTTGTAIHKFVERIDSGEEDVVIPPDIAPDIDAYRELLKAEHLTPVETEVTVVVDGIAPTPTAEGISGRFDAIYTTATPCPTCQTNRIIGDLKTGKIDYSRAKFPMQLTTYASGKRYNAETGERTDLNVCQCWGVVIHVPAKSGHARAWWADLTEARELLGVAYSVWEGRQADLLRPDSPFRPVQQAEPVTADSAAATPPENITSLISIAADRHNLEGLWRWFTAAGEWRDEHDMAARKRLEELEGIKS